MGCLIIALMMLIPGGMKAQEKTDGSGAIVIYNSYSMSGLAAEWASEYSASNPGLKFKAVSLPDKELGKMILSGGNLCILTAYDPVEEKGDAGFQIVLGREVIVPVVNRANPYLKDLDTKGISAGTFEALLEDAGNMRWGSVLRNNAREPVSLYCLDQATVKTGLSRFIPGFPEKEKSFRTLDILNLRKALAADPYAIGFCRLTDLIDPATKNLVQDLSIVPVDRNQNGSLDHSEQIYGSLDEFNRGVWIGKYPKSLVNNIYCMARTRPVKIGETAFLAWALTSGQEDLPLGGFTALAFSEKQSQMDKILTTSIQPAASTASGFSLARIVLLILVGIVVVSIILDVVIRRYKRRKEGLRHVFPGRPAAMEEKFMHIPGGIFFDKSHTWAFMEQDGMVKVGIDDFMQHVTGPITRLEMKVPGEKIKKGDHLCTLVQKGKQLRLFSPVSGIVKAQNTVLSYDPTVLNRSPYHEGWVYLIEPTNWIREIGLLSMADKYRSWLNGEFARLRDFLTTCVSQGRPGVQYVLQDGGPLRDNVLAELGPEVWEEFQTRFINYPK